RPRGRSDRRDRVGREPPGPHVRKSVSRQGQITPPLAGKTPIAGRSEAMIHDAAARGFDVAADDYESARPGYPPDAVFWLVEQLGLSESSVLVDLAAGTGKLTRLLAPLVGRTVAVEPVAAMRQRLHEVLPHIEVLEGTAEALPLKSGAVDAVTVAQAFHWFDVPRAAAEIVRVLRPDGRLALVW